MTRGVALALPIAAVALAVVALHHAHAQTTATPPATVNVKDLAFTPSQVTIPLGGSVKWVFFEGPHSVVSDSGETWCSAQSANSCIKAFDASGTFSYHCGIHPFMTGKVNVQPPTPPNQAPVANMTLSITGLKVHADASGSYDPDTDGRIAFVAWGWGDGSPSTGGTSADHAYATAGSYRLSLTVRDDKGASSTIDQNVTVRPEPPPNTPPLASFAIRLSALNVTVDASASSDPDGSIVTYAWDFGDGANGTGRIAKHTFNATGDHAIHLLVRDDRGGTAEVTNVAHVAPPTSPPPVAIKLHATSIQLEVDASASGTPDDAVTIASWDFGDGATFACPARCDPSRLERTHVYGRDGAFSVTVRVQDAWGFANASTVTATIRGDPAAAFEATVSGLTAQLDASALPHYANASYAWSADGFPIGEGATLAWTALHAGAHEIRLVLTDDAGSLTLAQTIETLGTTDATPTGVTAVETPHGRGTPAPSLALAAGAIAVAALLGVGSRRQR